MKRTNFHFAIIAAAIALGGAFASQARESKSALAPISRWRAPIGSSTPCNTVTCDTQGTVSCVNYAVNNTFSNAACTQLAPDLMRNP